MKLSPIIRISLRSTSGTGAAASRLSSSFSVSPQSQSELKLTSTRHILNRSIFHFHQPQIPIPSFLPRAYIVRNYHLDSSATFGTGIIEEGSKYNIEVKSIENPSGSSGAGTGAGDAADVSASAVETVGVTSLEHLPSPNIGFIGSIFSEAPPVLFTRDLLFQMHDFPGMDWAKTIILTTFGIRFLLCLPLGIAQHKSLAKLENLQPQFKQLATDLGRETSIAIKLYNWDKGTARRQFKKSFKKHWRSLIEEHNCHPMRSLFLVWLQVPFWICFSSALRNIVFAMPEPRTPEMLLHWMEMAGESPFWVESLATVDPFILPGIFLVANLISIQLHSARKLTVPQTKLQIALPWVFRIGVVGIATVAAFTPSAVTMYWATSSVCALIQNILLKTKPVRKFFGIPSTPSNP